MKKYLLSILIALAMIANPVLAQQRTFSLPNQNGHAGEFLMTNGIVPSWQVAGGGGVTSLNGLIGAVTLSPGTNISLVPVGNNITINATGGSIGDLIGGGTPYSILFIDQFGQLAEENPGFTYNPDANDLELDPFATITPHSNAYIEADTTSARLSYGTAPVSSQISALPFQVDLATDGTTTATQSLIRISSGLGAPTQTQYINVQPGTGGGKIELKHPTRVLATTPILDASAIINATTQYNHANLFLTNQDNTNGNVRLGNLSGNSFTVGSAQNNTVLGISAGSAITTGDRNTIIGRSAATGITTLSDHTVVGANALSVNSEGTAIGSSAKSSGGGVSVGYQAGQNTSTSVEGNTAVGYQALKSYTQPGGFPPFVTENTAVGYQAGLANIQSIQNTYVGYKAGVSDIGNQNTLIGAEAGFSLNDVNANENVFVGERAGRSTTTGGANVYVGGVTGFSNITGGSNTCVGQGACDGNTSGNFNQSLGYSQFTDGVSFSTTIGYYAKSTADREVVFGGENNVPMLGNNFELTSLWFGQGKTTTVPFSKISWHITPADGVADTLGTNWSFYDGAGTGNQPGGGYEFNIHPAGASGSTTNTSAPALTIDGNTGDIKLLGKVVNYNSISTVGNGVPSEYAEIDLTGQNAAITGAALYTADATAMYRISWYASVTLPASVSSVLGGTKGFQVDTCDADDGNAKQSPSATVAPSQTNNVNTVASMASGQVIVYAGAGCALTYNMDYTSVSGGGDDMQYNLHIKLEKL